MKKNRIIKYCCIVALGICALIYYFKNQNDVNYDDFFTNELENEVTVSEQTVDNNSKIKIYITGAVKNSGVFEVEEGSRIDDAVKIAGGLNEDADLSDVNLAYELCDGEKIYIPSINDEETLEESCSSTNGKVNINKATVSELTQISGIGNSTAQKIIEYREKNGKFSSIDDIKNVPGIGDSKFESIKEYISVK